MKQLDLLNEFRELVSQLSTEVKSASSMQQYDTHSVSENLMLDLLKEMHFWEDLENLNQKEVNFPAVDLGSDKERVSIQVTATSDLDKVKSTLTTFFNHNLHNQYDRVIIYVLTERQNSYSQDAINKVLIDDFKFDAKNDIWDYKDLCEQAISLSPQKLLNTNKILTAYLRGVEIGLADEDIDPPTTILEQTTLNLVELYFPSNLYIADIRNEVTEGKKGRKKTNERKAIREYCQKDCITLPSAYVAHAGKLISFFDLEDSNNPYRHVIEEGTAEPLHPRDFYEIDDDHERVFKSLLRFSLQQRLYQEKVVWYNQEGLFVFMPIDNKKNTREEKWVDKKAASRAVFVRTFNKKDSTKVFAQKHFAFAVDFVLTDDNWYLAITPEWFFSMGNDFRKSGFADDNISWLKRNETNRSVDNHFRFTVAWLKGIDELDLFQETNAADQFLSFGDTVTLEGHPLLDEKIWEPLKENNEDETSMGSLF